MLELQGATVRYGGFTAVADIKPADDTQRIVFDRLLEIANQASTHRDERLAISVKRMPRTLFAFVIVCAAVLILRVCQPEAHRPFRCPMKMPHPWRRYASVSMEFRWRSSWPLRA